MSPAIDPLILKSNEKIIRKASRRDVRPKKRFVIWASINGLWEQWDFYISRWFQYLEAIQVYDCMLMRNNLDNIRVALYPLEGHIPDNPISDTSPSYRLKIGIFSDAYMREKGF